MQTVDGVPETERLAPVGANRPRGARSSEPPTSFGKLLYHVVRDRIVDQPSLFYAFWRSRENNIFEKRVTRADSTIVIEGFPRSGNTFAYYAFLLAQSADLDGASQFHVGNHMHCVSQFALAHRWHVPAVLVIRRPKDVVVSNYIYASESLPLSYHLRRYTTFHESVRRFKDSIVVSDFPETTRRFGSVIWRVNAKYGTNFNVIEDTPETQERALAEVEKKHAWRKSVYPDTGKPNQVSFPSADKNSRKSMVEDLLTNPKYRDLLARAEAAYQALI